MHFLDGGDGHDIWVSAISIYITSMRIYIYIYIYIFIYLFITMFAKFVLVARG